MTRSEASRRAQAVLEHSWVTRFTARSVVMTSRLKRAIRESQLKTTLKWKKEELVWNDEWRKNR